MRNLAWFEIKHYLSNIKEIAYIYSIFLLYILLFAFAMGPDEGALARHGQVAMWVALVATALGSQHVCFDQENRQAWRDFWGIYPMTPEGVILIKLLVYMVFIITPTVIFMPIGWSMMGLERAAFWPFFSHILVAAAGLCAVNFMVAALMSSLQYAVGMAALIAGPLCVPLLIFGVEAAASPFLTSNASVMCVALSVFYGLLAWWVSAFVTKE